MSLLVLHILAAAFITEALTELVIKSVFFKYFRTQVSRLGEWVEELFKCGYCFSVWVAIVIVGVTGCSVPVSAYFIFNSFVTVLIVHRLSNVMHNIIDKWTDKYYDMRYVNTDKG